jgi:hypothetical protein
VDEEIRKPRRLDVAGLIECTECGRAIDEFLAIEDRWTYWSDGTDLRPFCPDCAEREFEHRPVGTASDD